LAGASTLIGGPFAPALAGAIVGGGNSFVSQGFAEGNGKSWSWSNIDYKQVGISSLTGAITGYVAGQMSDKISPYISKYVSALTASPVIQDMVTNAAVQSTTGFTINTGWSLANGDSWDDALNKGWDGFKNGLVVGGATGAFSGFQRSQAENVNWLTGESDVKGNYSVYQGVDPNTGEVKYVGITERDPQLRFNEHLNSGTDRADLRYRSIKSGLTKTGARIYEQNLINQYGMQKYGGSLFNLRNSIAPKYWNKYGIK